MKWFREETIHLLAEAIEGDQFNDLAQIDTMGDIDPEFVDFFRRNLYGSSKGGLVLEIGCGSGRFFKHLPITHAIDASTAMVERAKATRDKIIEDMIREDDVITIQQGVAECIPFRDQFSSILFSNGWFQIRSDYEALIEINQHLHMGGTFIFNIYTEDHEDIICGRVLGPNNYLRVCREFGFDVQEFRPSQGLFALRKVANFRPSMLRKLQLVKDKTDVTKELYEVLNLDKIRDRSIT